MTDKELEIFKRHAFENPVACEIESIKPEVITDRTCSTSGKLYQLQDGMVVCEKHKELLWENFMQFRLRHKSKVDQLKDKVEEVIDSIQKEEGVKH